MSNQDKINLIEEALELSPNTINENTQLSDIEEYDSMGKLSIIILFDEEFKMKLTGESLKEFKTIGDIVNFSEQ